MSLCMGSESCSRREVLTKPSVDTLPGRRWKTNSPSCQERRVLRGGGVDSGALMQLTIVPRARTLGLDSVIDSLQGGIISLYKGQNPGPSVCFEPKLTGTLRRGIHVWYWYARCIRWQISGEDSEFYLGQEDGADRIMNRRKHCPQYMLTARQAAESQVSWCLLLIPDMQIYCCLPLFPKHGSTNASLHTSGTICWSLPRVARCPDWPWSRSASPKRLPCHCEHHIKVTEHSKSLRRKSRTRHYV